jgi:hypothetical protein
MEREPKVVIKLDPGSVVKFEQAQQLTRELTGGGQKARLDINYSSNKGWRGEIKIYKKDTKS